MFFSALYWINFNLELLDIWDVPLILIFYLYIVYKTLYKKEPLSTIVLVITTVLLLYELFVIVVYASIMLMPPMIK